MTATFRIAALTILPCQINRLFAGRRWLNASGIFQHPVDFLKNFPNTLRETQFLP